MASIIQCNKNSWFRSDYSIVVLLLFFSTFGTGLAHSPSETKNPPLRPIASAVSYTGGDFTLKSKDGPVSLTDYRGKVVVLVFGFTQCPDVCPTTLQIMADILGEVPDKHKSEFKILFITLDPERDTAQKIHDYTQHFHKNILGLTGTIDEIQHVMKLYGVRSKRVDFDKTGKSYGFEHSSDVYLVKPDGQLGYSFPIQAPSHVIKEAVLLELTGKVFK
jgi:protein SCO1/2